MKAEDIVNRFSDMVVHLEFRAPEELSQAVDQARQCNILVELELTGKVVTAAFDGRSKYIRDLKNGVGALGRTEYTVVKIWQDLQQIEFLILFFAADSLVTPFVDLAPFDYDCAGLSFIVVWLIDLQVIIPHLLSFNKCGYEVFLLFQLA